MLASTHAAYLGAPMIAPDQSIHGVLAVYSTRPREWREEESDALHALAGSAAAARTTAELYQGVKHEQQRARRSSATSPTASSPSIATATSFSGTRPRSGSPAFRPATRSAAPRRCWGGRSNEGPAGSGSRLVPIRRGSDEVWLSLSEAVMTDPAGAVAGRIFAFRDISAERAVEQMKSDFVSTVSHELRTPLTSIYGFAETLLRQDVLFGEEERATFLGTSPPSRSG